MSAEDSNFRVYVRCRNGLSLPSGQAPYKVISSREIVRNSTPPKQYEFDRVFDERGTQQHIFEECALPLIDGFLRGYNATLFAYGQTGTGKTYTITGDCLSSRVSERAGIVPRVLENVFDRLQSSSDSQDWVLELKYVELYNEELRDLLSTEATQPPRTRSTPAGTTTSSNPSKQLRIIENKNTHSIEVVGAESVPVTNLESALRVVKTATARRQTAATQINADSSRSHSVLTLILVSREPVSGMAVRSKLHLVDLAGSENVARSGAVRARAQEAGEINKSLLALGRIIEMLVSSERSSSASISASASTTSASSSSPPNSGLATNRNKSGKPYISYRESKLTHLLQDSLGGATRTCMIATISLIPSNIEESRSTLEYASRARSIRNQPQTEVEVMEMKGTLKGLSLRLEELQQELMMQRSRDGGVYVSTYAYNQLKASQQKHAELLAQRETSAKHRLLELEALKKTNTALNAERDLLQSKIGTLEEQARNYVAYTASMNDLKTSADHIDNQLSKYSDQVKMVSAVFQQQLGEIPAALENLSKQLNGVSTADEIPKLKANLLSSTSKVSRQIHQTVQNAVDNALKQIDQGVRKTVDSMANHVKESLTDVESNMSKAKANCVKLRRHYDTMQADIAMQRQSSAEVLRMVNELKAHDEQYTRVMNQMAEERRSMLDKVISKQQQDALPRISTDSSNMLDLITSVTSDVSKPVSSFPESELRIPSELSTQLGAKLYAEVDTNVKTLDDELSNAITASINAYEHTTMSTQQEPLSALRQALVSIAQGSRKHENSSNKQLTALDDNKNNVVAEISKLKQIIAGNRATMAPSASQRSPVSSPQKHRRPPQSGTGSPSRSGMRSPVREIMRDLPRSPFKQIVNTNRTQQQSNSLRKEPAAGRIPSLQPPQSILATRPSSNRAPPPLRRPPQSKRPRLNESN